MRRPWLVAMALCLISVGCARNPEPPPDPPELLRDAIRATERAETARFTHDGAGSVQMPDQPAQDLFFAATGFLQFPDRVQMVMHIDQPDDEGSRRDILYIGRILYVRPTGVQGAQWQRSESPVLIPGFDPLEAFDLPTLEETREPRHGGDDELNGVPVRRLTLDPREEFRQRAEDRLPEGFADTRLEIHQEMWVERDSGRVVRVVLRYDYIGATTGYFETDTRLTDFELDLTIEAPPPGEISDQPLPGDPVS